jgi:hypothetical protein
MTKIAIRCHPSVPLSPDELGAWLEHQVADLRALAPEATIRLSRLAQALPSRDVDVGWLIELELSEPEEALVRDRLVEAVRDMGLLGFQPTVLRSVEVTEWAVPGNGRLASSSRPHRFSEREWWD